MGSALLINVLLFSVFLLDASSLAVRVRSKCESRDVTQKFIEGKEENEMKSRLQALRGEMLIHSDHRGPQISAYIVTTFDEHQTYQTDDTEGQLQFISGFSGPTGYAVISSQAAALWIDAINFEQADSELSCEWEIFSLSEEPSIAQWLANHLQQDSSIGADPKVVPHQLWHEWEREFRHHYLSLVKVKNLIDIIWIDKPQPPRDYVIRTQSSEFAGEAWQQKVQKLRKHLRTFQCDSMVITSLTEIAYLLNLRGGDFRYLPVFTSYAIINKDETLLYTNKSKISMQADLLLNANLNGDPCSKPPCVIVKHYHEFWRDLRFFSRQWKRVLLPSDSNIEMGASEAIRAALPPEIIFHHTSPIIRMRAVKNPVEKEGMRRAHLKDAAAMCETLSYLEERFDAGDTWNEEMLAKETDKSRYEQQDNRGLSYRTIVAFGPNAAKLHYYPKPNASAGIANTNLILIDSGGQYLDGTTAVARTIHLGQPTVEQKKAYTNALLGLIRLSTLIFPHDINPSSLDSIIRGPTWTERQDYQHLTGSGIGSYLSAVESPISIAYSIKHPYHFRGGNFFSVAPGIYKPDKFGIRLKNVFEVLSDEKDSGFFNMQSVTLVPFQTKLIDRNSLSPADKKWLNRYNAEIRIKVGVELKQQLKMTAFYWMMNQTAHITEYTTKEDLRAASSSGQIDISMLLLSSFVFIASFFSHSA